MLDKNQAVRIQNYLDNHVADYLDILSDLVSIETPTYGSLENMNRCVNYLVNIFGELGCHTNRIKRDGVGDHIVVNMPFTGKDKILILGHYDTVFPIGTINDMPFKLEDNKVLGPGVVDMKGGIVQIFYAIKALIELCLIPEKDIVLVLTSDEEGGSQTSKELIKNEASNSKCALVLEPGFPDINAIKTARFARGVYQIEAFGIASHAGNCPEKGVSAIDELIFVKSQIDKWNNIEKGSTSTITYMHGGNRGASVIPDYATMNLDVRAKDNLLAEIIHDAVITLKPLRKEAKIVVNGGIEKPALEFDGKNTMLFNSAKQIATEFGLDLQGRSVRGGSDGNFSYHAGAPTLDGLGMSGDNLHNANEYIVLNSISKRTALLAGLLLSL